MRRLCVFIAVAIIGYLIKYTFATHSPLLRSLVVRCVGVNVLKSSDDYAMGQTLFHIYNIESRECHMKWIRGEKNTTMYAHLQTVWPTA